MSIATIPLPGWTANITMVVFALAFGRFLIPKVMEKINNLLTALRVEEPVAKGFTDIVTSLFWMYILGLSLEKIPVLFSPNIFPVDLVGGILLTFVGYTFSLMTPIVLIYIAFKMRQGTV